MNTVNVGGSAFPDPGRAQSAKQRERLTETGLTVLDYFAAHAPITIADARSAWYASEGAADATITDLLHTLAALRSAYALEMLAFRPRPVNAAGAA